MTFGSLFAGIGGFDLGLERAGMTCKWQCEIDKHANVILNKHWPNVPKYPDVRKIGGSNLEPVDLICGGFPCQDLSLAGNRKGLDGERSGLFFEAARIIDEIKPKWFILENVPGLLSSNQGQDMATVIETLTEIGYCVSWRVLDSQYFGVAQRRKRVFIVGSLGNSGSAKVLFEQGSVSRSATKGKKEGGKTFRTVARDYRGIGSTIDDKLIIDLNPKGEPRFYHNESPTLNTSQGGQRQPCVIAPTLRGFGHGWQGQQNSTHSVVVQNKIRRLTPLECERLQGFPDNWTEGISDTQRYKTLGNAVTVNVIEWIGKRIINAQS